MAEIFKVSVLQKNEEEFPIGTEVNFSIQNVHNETPEDQNLKGQDLKAVLEFIRKNTLYRRDFPEDRVEIPQRHVMQMHSPVIDGELYVDGEVYIL